MLEVLPSLVPSPRTGRARRLHIPPALLVTVATLAPAASPGTDPGADWPQWRGPNRDDRSAETGLLQTWPEGGPKLLWKAEGAGVGYSGIAVSGGRVLTLGKVGSDEMAIAFDLETGRKLWSTRNGEAHVDTRGSGPRSTPTASGDVLYVLGAKGDLSCLRSSDGKALWHANVLERFGGQSGKWGMAESPLLEDGKVIVSAGGKDSAIVALDGKTGETVWTSKGLTVKTAYSSAIAADLGGVRQVVNFVHGAAVGVSTADGTPLWRYEKCANPVANCATPIVDGNRVLLTSDYGAGAALLEISPDASQASKVSAREVYFTKELENHHGGVVLLGGRVYGHSGGNDEDTHTFVCMEFPTGKVLWKDPGIGKCSITFADGCLYALTEDGVAGLIEPSPERFILRGKFVFRKYAGKVRRDGLEKDDSEKPCWTHPVVARGRLFLRYQDSISCYDVKSK